MPYGEPSPSQSPAISATTSPPGSVTAPPNMQASPAPSVPSMVSPCPHTPPCPPPGPCLPDALRVRQAGTSQAPKLAVTQAAFPAGPGGGPPGPPGYEVAAGFIRKFAGTVGGSADGVRRLGDATPRFQGWNLAPLAGIPIVGLAFVHRFNFVSDTWSTAAGILGDALHTDGETLVRAADNYVAAEKASKAAIQQTRP
ncbi:hypothetical protein ABZ860_08300 [Microbispora sp. NPDC046973]|uniref:hypothetical protein n=1 Tax=Microbispora sp. NPDC046973 TaxID=3155022 RepID=UPI0033F7FC9E